LALQRHDGCRAKESYGSKTWFEREERSLRGRWSGRERRMLGGLQFRQGTVIVITCQEHASTRGPSIASVVHSLKERLGLTNMRYCNFAFGLRVHSPVPAAQARRILHLCSTLKAKTKCTLQPSCAQAGQHGKVSHAVLTCSS
jgi:hypothetical protein